MLILGIETSCDETAAAVVKDGHILLSNVIASSVDLHKQYGGVVPEIAARSHIESIIPVIDQALRDAFVAKSQELGAKSNKKLSAMDSQLSAGFDPWDQIDAIAVTKGPGLIGSLLIGVQTARTLAIAKNKPLYGINHVEAHVYASFLTDTHLPDYELPKTKPEFPCLALVVSGGHTQLVLFTSHGNYQVLGRTKDDAIGEAFDKVAKIVGLPYPGGPSVAKAAKPGDPASIKLSLAKLENSYDFSYSGLKTAVLRAAQTMVGKDYTLPSHKLPSLLNKSQQANIAASFQATAITMLVGPLKKAIDQYGPASVVVVGGVAANQELRRQVAHLSPAPIFTDPKLCTDNAAMIATCAYYKADTAKVDPYALLPDSTLQM